MADPISAMYFFTGLECLVDLEEVSDFIEFVDGNISEILDCMLANISCCNAEKLVIAALFIRVPRT